MQPAFTSEVSEPRPPDGRDGRNSKGRGYRCRKPKKSGPRLLVGGNFRLVGGFHFFRFGNENRAAILRAGLVTGLFQVSDQLVATLKNAREALLATKRENVKGFRRAVAHETVRIEPRSDVQRQDALFGAGVLAENAPSGGAANLPAWVALQSVHQGGENLRIVAEITVGTAAEFLGRADAVAAGAAI